MHSRQKLSSLTLLLLLPAFSAFCKERIYRADCRGSTLVFNYGDDEYLLQFMNNEYGQQSCEAEVGRLKKAEKFPLLTCACTDQYHGTNGGIFLFCHQINSDGSVKRDAKKASFRNNKDGWDECEAIKASFYSEDLQSNGSDQHTPSNPKVNHDNLKNVKRSSVMTPKGLTDGTGTSNVR